MRVPCLLHVGSDVPVPRGISRPRTVFRLGRLPVSCQRASANMLVEYSNRTPEQRTLNPRARESPPGGPLAPNWGFHRRPYLCPSRSQLPPGNSPAVNGQGPPRVHAVYSGTSQVYSRADQQVRLMVKSMRAWPHAADANRRRAGCGRPCDGATWPRAARSGAGRQAGHTVPGTGAEGPRGRGAEGPRGRRTRSPKRRDHPTRRPHVRPENAAGAARPWPSVEQPTVRTDRDGARIPSAIRPWTPRHAAPQRYKMTHHGTEKKRPA
jgi:hypothetical protein